MLGNSINIKIFNLNPVVLKKIAKTSKNYSFSRRPNFGKNGVTIGHAQIKKNNFFSEILTPDPKLSKPFYFNKIPYVLAEL